MAKSRSFPFAVVLLTIWHFARSFFFSAKGHKKFLLKEQEIEWFWLKDLIQQLKLLFDWKLKENQQVPSHNHLDLGKAVSTVDACFDGLSFWRIRRSKQTWKLERKNMISNISYFFTGKCNM